MPKSRLTLARLIGLALIAAAFLLDPVAATAQAARPGGTMTLFKIISLKDDIVIGFGPADTAAVGAEPSAETVAAALGSKAHLGAWLYGPRRGTDGQPVMAPLRRVALLAPATVRIESYTAEQPVLPPEK